MFPVLQMNLGLPSESVPVKFSVPEVGGVSSALMPLVAAGVGLVLLVMFVLILRAILRHRHQTASSFRKHVLLVTVPKEQAEKGEAGLQEKSLQEIQEDIAVMEGVFAGIGGLRAERGLKAWFLGREDSVSFEIVADRGLVSFYVAVPPHLKDFMEQLIQSQYPHAQVEEVPDYNIFSPSGHVVSAGMIFRRLHVFPLKSFRKMEADPLNSITNSLAKVDKDDGAAVQVIVRSARAKWRQPAVKLASDMQQGKKLSEAMAGLSWVGAATAGWGSAMGTAKKQPEEQKKEYRLSPMEEEMVKSIEEKAGKLGLDVTVRFAASSRTREKARIYLENLIGAFGQFNSPQYGNSLVRYSRSQKRMVSDFIFRRFDEGRHMVMTGDELAGMYHMPLPSTETPNIR